MEAPWPSFVWVSEQTQGTKLILVNNHKNPYLSIKSKTAFSSVFTHTPKGLLALRVCKALCTGYRPPLWGAAQQRSYPGKPDRQILPPRWSLSHIPKRKTGEHFQEPGECGCTHREFCGCHGGSGASSLLKGEGRTKKRTCRWTVIST